MKGSDILGFLEEEMTTGHMLLSSVPNPRMFSHTELKFRYNSYAGET